MNILFLTIGNLKSVEEPGIYSDLLREFSQQGHTVTIMSPLEKRLNMRTQFEQHHNVSYLKVKIGNITKTNLVEKGISTLLIESQFLTALKKYLNDVKFDLIMYSTPPITFEKVIKYIKKRDGAKSYLLLKDIFPQNAVDLNMFSEKSVFNQFFRHKEKKLYLNSDYIGCMSEANRQFILKHNDYISPNKVEVCPNSIEPLTITNSKDNVVAIRRKYNIPLNKTIFIYGGNLGKPQGIDFLIECLRSNKQNEQAYFVIAGSGTEFPKLKQFFDSEKMKNAQLLEQLPKDDYELLANSCDVGLIFLDKRFTIPNFPSRLLSYMQASMPVLAATDVNTDIGQVIEEGQFGYWCESRYVEDFNKQLAKFYNEENRKVLGTNARQYLENHYTVKHVYDIIMKHFK